MREKHITDREALEETMGYEHTVEGMSLKRHTIYHFCCDTIMTTKEIEGNVICACTTKHKENESEYKHNKNRL